MLGRFSAEAVRGSWNFLHVDYSDPKGTFRNHRLLMRMSASMPRAVSSWDRVADQLRGETGDAG